MHKKESGMELLKLFFGPTKDGAWAINSMGSLKIKPKGTEEDFYLIADEMAIFQPATFGSTTYFIGQSIVPVVAQVNGEGVLRCIGTGFLLAVQVYL